MKKFLFQLLGLTILCNVILTSCAEDDPLGTGGTPLAPVASLVVESGFVSDTATVDPGAEFKVKLRLQTGSDELRSVKILEDGVNLAPARFKINDGNITANNPFLITGSSKSGATYEITVTAHEGFEVTKRYTFEVTSDDNLTDDVFVTITTSGIPVMELTGKLLLNQAGPAGQGGLDLDTGESVGSVMSNTGNPAIDTSYKRAEINDEGINNGPLETNWLQQISGTNGAEVRYIGGAMPENFNFDNVKFVEEIVAAFDTGRNFTAKDSTGELISDPLKVGDVLTVKRGTKYYMIKVTKINVTTNNNNDSYEFSIKK